MIIEIKMTFKDENKEVVMNGLAIADHAVALMSRSPKHYLTGECSTVVTEMCAEALERLKV